MQNVLLPGAVVLLTVVLWLRRKPVKPMLSSTDASRVAQINRAQLELVIEPVSDGESADISLESWTAPSSPLERLALERRLKADMEAGPEERLRAVRLAARWGHRSALPLLRQALRDSDARGGRSCRCDLTVPRCAGRFPDPSAGSAAAQCFADAINRSVLAFVVSADQQFA